MNVRLGIRMYLRGIAVLSALALPIVVPFGDRDVPARNPSQRRSPSEIVMIDRHNRTRYRGLLSQARARAAATANFRRPTRRASQGSDQEFHSHPMPALGRCARRAPGCRRSQDLCKA
jgi:hypothetical protein